ncbi:PIG-L deacetylase family protein [Paenibacillus sepulcri]|uniref:PIG-L family deacetylase n=1 Tax=Paenibacillus sepulcri TaxID=359917 RepID=A0ABS7BV19_9BACL|nr:PIG-L family deacetylase [Paenibacillus sepulcri]
MTKVIVIAPHPDDETLGCGGTLLKHKEQGHEIHWVIITKISDLLNYSIEQIQEREWEIDEVEQLYQFDSVRKLAFPAAGLDHSMISDLVRSIGQVFKEIQPNVVYIPYRGDVHTDHAVVFDAAIACCKWFRYPSVVKVLVYETLSETEFGINSDLNGFRPQVFHNIDKYLTAKINIMLKFKSEVAEFPFPRSEEAIRSLAKVRGVASGCKAAEAFMLLKEVWM